MESKEGKLIVFEGSDGAGKTTQCNLLKKDLIASGELVVDHHFPSYGTYYGAPVEHYLKGDFGTPDENSSYFVNSLFAIDRAIAWRKTLKGFYEKGQTILLDRYTSSSLLYQSLQFENLDEKKRFIDFVVDFEYNKLGIKEPDKVIFLKLPWEISMRSVIAREKETGAKRDIHEIDPDYIRRVNENSDFVADYLSWDVVECFDGKDILPVEEIHQKVLSLLPKK